MSGGPGGEAPGPARALRIGNGSGFYGDRISAARELVDGAALDVLTGDWLAELTLHILVRQRERDPRRGYATTFLTQVEQVLGTCLERGIRIVANAGGLNVAGCAEAVEALAERLGLVVRVARVEGDDLLPDLGALIEAGELRQAGGAPVDLAGRAPLTANAYLGGWGIAAALARGADVVVTGRVTDAALVLGPAAWHHRWRRDDWDRLAGALLVGHVLECGTQATGGNYAFFRELDGIERAGFPVAEIAEDGSAVITTAPGSGGEVSVGTVTAQLLYEIAEPRYVNPDVCARFDSVALEPDGPGRVRLSGTRGEPPPAELKVALTVAGGYRNDLTFVLTGLDVEEKAALAERAVWAGVPGGRAAFDDVAVELLGRPVPDATTPEEAVAFLRVAVRSGDERVAGTVFTRAAVETGLSSYPGLFLTGPPRAAAAVGVYLPAFVPAARVTQRVVDRDGALEIPHSPGAPPPPQGQPAALAALDPLAAQQGGLAPAVTRDSAEPTLRVPLGQVCGARSGDKGGDANVGVWARTAETHAWLGAWLTVERFRSLLPECAGLDVRRHELANLRALNFVVRRLLGEGVGSSLRLDAQAKGLGERLRARVVEVPARLLPPEDTGKPARTALLP